MIELIFLCLFVASLAAKTRTILIFGLVYTSIQIAHHFAFDGESALYYWLAMTCPLVSMGPSVYLSVKFQTKWQLLPLSIIMGLSIIHGYYGLTVYKAYGDVEALNLYGFVLYALVIAGLLWSHNVGQLDGLGGNSDVLNRAPLWGLAGSNAGSK